MNWKTPDLTAHAPRSPRCKLGGYVILPRMLDKGRAQIAGKNGEYHYSCPLDKRWFEFVGVEPLELLGELESGAGDMAVLKWIGSNARNSHSPVEIEAWSRWQETRVPGDLESREFFNEIHSVAGKDREDIVTWFDLLDLDDYVTFGGAA
ncbi:MAG: DUF5069 domain-containing protein [Verrucomicrobiae bacterium]|nr:DUF5069 domain-containing protein [Verrucomicrobiae bacterium]